jgi:hypothetical protein
MEKSIHAAWKLSIWNLQWERSVAYGADGEIDPHGRLDDVFDEALHRVDACFFDRLFNVTLSAIADGAIELYEKRVGVFAGDVGFVNDYHRSVEPRREMKVCRPTISA